MRIGIDLGGSKIEIIVLDRDGSTRMRERVATPAGDYAGTLDAVAGLVASAGIADAPIGIGTPGAVSSASGRMKNANSLVLNGKPLETDLRERLGRPVRLANDANCFALSESIGGAGEGARVVFGVILGTGVGGGIALEQSVLTGANSIAGEWGHNPLPWPDAGELPGPLCYCGKRGCIETFLCGPGMAQRFFERTGRTLSAHEIDSAANAGDEQAVDELRIYVDRLARGLSTVVNILDPDAIVLGGGLSNIASLYSRLPIAMQRHVFSDTFTTPIRQPRFGDSSGVRGAAFLWPEYEAPATDSSRPVT